MVDHVDATQHPEAIDLQDLVVEAPVSSAKPGEQIPKPKVKKIKTPTTEHTATQDAAPKEKSAQFAPTLTQPLASMPPSEQNPVSTAPAAHTDIQSDAPQYYDHAFIMEQLDKFVENRFNGEVASLPIPAEVAAQASDVIKDMRNDSVEINNLQAKLNDLNDQM
jgi:hypothetical protein